MIHAISIKLGVHRVLSHLGLTLSALVIAVSGLTILPAVSGYACSSSPSSSGSPSSDSNGSRGSEDRGSKGSEDRSSKESESKGSKSNEDNGSKKEHSASKDSSDKGSKSADNHGSKASDDKGSKASDDKGSKAGDDKGSSIGTSTTGSNSGSPNGTSSGNLSADSTNTTSTAGSGVLGISTETVPAPAKTVQAASVHPAGGVLAASIQAPNTGMGPALWAASVGLVSVIVGTLLMGLTYRRRQIS